MAKRCRKPSFSAVRIPRRAKTIEGKQLMGRRWRGEWATGGGVTGRKYLGTAGRFGLLI
jgi:hypothetical protein